MVEEAPKRREPRAHSSSALSSLLDRRTGPGVSRLLMPAVFALAGIATGLIVHEFGPSFVSGVQRTIPEIIPTITSQFEGYIHMTEYDFSVSPFLGLLDIGEGLFISSLPVMPFILARLAGRDSAKDKK